MQFLVSASEPHPRSCLERPGREPREGPVRAQGPSPASAFKPSGAELAGTTAIPPVYPLECGMSFSFACRRFQPKGNATPKRVVAPFAISNDHSLALVTCPPPATGCESPYTTRSRFRRALIALLVLSACTPSVVAPSSERSEPNPGQVEPPASASPTRRDEPLTDLHQRQISFMSGRGEKWGIYVANADGSGRRLVAFVPTAYGGQHWSRTARAFVTRVEVPVSEKRSKGYVLRIEMNGQTASLSARNGGDTDAMVGWSPDGKKIVFISTRADDDYPQLYVMNSQGRGVRRLVETQFEVQYPQWSPDGHTIAFTGVIGGNFDLFLVDADGGNLRRLTESPGSENWPTWSGDSTQIAFSLDEEIWAINATGTNPHLVTTPQQARGGEPNWSPDGDLIAFACGLAKPQVCAIRPDGTGFTKLFGRASFPYWVR